MRKNVFSSSIKILIVSLLLLAVFFQKERSQKLMALALILWGAVTAGIFLFRKSGKLAKKCSAFSASLKQAGRTAKAPAEKTAEPVPKADTEPAEPAAPTKPAPDSRETETMLLHISLRITEKLKSAYPQSVWQWKDTPSLQGILAGGTVRILVENMDAYTHADISFDRFGRIHVEPMTIGSFAEPSGNGTSAGPGTGDADAAEEMPPEPSVVDVRVWYELVGQTSASPAAYCWTLDTDHRLERQRPYEAHHQGKRGYRRQQAEKGGAEGHPGLLPGKELLGGTGLAAGRRRTERKDRGKHPAGLMDLGHPIKNAEKKGRMNHGKITFIQQLDLEARHA